MYVKFHNFRSAPCFGAFTTLLCLSDMMQRLGLSADIKAKTKLFPSGTEVAEAVARGETEIGIGVASDAKIVPGKVRQPYQESAQAKRQFIEPIQRIRPTRQITSGFPK